MLKTYPESAHSLSLSNLCKYIYGGRGVVTLKSPSGTQHSYAFRKPLEGDEFPPDVVFVYAVHDIGTLCTSGKIISQVDACPPVGWRGASRRSGA